VGSWGANTVTFRCNGGARFQNTSTSLYAKWSPGDGNWVVVSDQNLKENLAPVDSKAVLEKVAALPIAEWNYKGYGQRNIGPMAQDFHALFPFEGSTETSLNAGHLDGVALAAIQGLYQENQELKKKLEEVALALAALQKQGL
jgi:hypothetical protein